LVVSDRLPSEKWHYRIEESGVISIIDLAFDELDTITVPGPSEQADVDRLRAVLAYTRRRLDLTDPILVSEASLNEIAAAVSSTRQNIEQIRTSGSAAYLGAAMGMVETLLIAVARLPVIAFADDAAASLKAFKLSVGGSKSQATRQFDDFRVSMQASQAEFEQRSAALSGELSRLEQAVANAVATTQSTHESQRVSFDEAQTSRSAMWDKQLVDLRASLDSTLASARDMLQDQTEAAAGKLAEAVAEAEVGNRRLNTILGIVADKGLVGQYSLTAIRERKSVVVWRAFAGLVAIGAIAVAFEAARHASKIDDGSWRPLTAKAVLTVVIAGLAAFCASVANDHRRAEQTAERTALQLAAIKPYLEDISNVELRDEVMVATASRMFGTVTADEVGNVPSPTLTSHATAQIAGDLAKMVDKMVDAKLRGGEV
jgi:hypothetical protein